MKSYKKLLYSASLLFLANAQAMKSNNTKQENSVLNKICFATDSFTSNLLIIEDELNFFLSKKTKKLKNNMEYIFVDKKNEITKNILGEISLSIIQISEQIKEFEPKKEELQNFNINEKRKIERIFDLLRKFQEDLMKNFIKNTNDLIFSLEKNNDIQKLKNFIETKIKPIVNKITVKNGKEFWKKEIFIKSNFESNYNPFEDNQIINNNNLILNNNQNIFSDSKKSFCEEIEKEAQEIDELLKQLEFSEEKPEENKNKKNYAFEQNLEKSFNDISKVVQQDFQKSFNNISKIAQQDLQKSFNSVNKKSNKIEKSIVEKKSNKIENNNALESQEMLNQLEYFGNILKSIESSQNNERNAMEATENVYMFVSQLLSTRNPNTILIEDFSKFLSKNNKEKEDKFLLEQNLVLLFSNLEISIENTHSIKRNTISRRVLSLLENMIERYNDAYTMTFIQHFILSIKEICIMSNEDYTCYLSVQLLYLHIMSYIIKVEHSKLI